MTHKILTLLIFFSLFLLLGCNQKKEYSVEDFTLDDNGAPSMDLSGDWAAEWIDPERKTKETFVMSIEQMQGTLSGRAAFNDGNETKADITGRVSGSHLLIQMNPKPTAPYISLPETTWTGEITENGIIGEWFLNGRPYSGYANTGPWSAKIVK
ncbi:hypothetical protein [Cerasicoccus fimbriatus]|uniref:hypothetical protein n=1 Tax=Cerasicoccus fimbriatus TaxID=3014554 RepID=UPI0022B4BD2B|nr:hypothetical protein [Cerasicoccus sp. TK19100]